MGEGIKDPQNSVNVIYEWPFDTKVQKYARQIIEVNQNIGL